jgi:phage shock protein A
MNEKEERYILQIVRNSLTNELDDRIRLLDDKIDDLESRNRQLEDQIEELIGRVWKLESEYALESDLHDTLRINEIDAWSINHKTISNKIEERILAKLKGLE